MKKLIIVLSLLVPSLGFAQGGPISVNGKHVTLNSESGGSVNLSVNGVAQWSSDGSVQTNAGIVAVVTPAATATPPPSASGNIIIVPTIAAGGVFRLPTCEAGRRFRVINTGSNAIRVFPPTGAALDAQTTPAPLSVAAGASGDVTCTSTTRAYTGQVAPLPTP